MVRTSTKFVADHRIDGPHTPYGLSATGVEYYESDQPHPRKNHRGGGHTQIETESDEYMWIIGLREKRDGVVT